MLYKQVDAPFAYICADSRIYDATEWYICQVYFSLFDLISLYIYAFPDEYTESKII